MNFNQTLPWKTADAKIEVLESPQRPTTIKGSHFQAPMIKTDRLDQ